MKPKYIKRTRILNKAIKYGGVNNLDKASIRFEYKILLVLIYERLKNSPAYLKLNETEFAKLLINILGINISYAGIVIASCKPLTPRPRLIQLQERLKGIDTTNLDKIFTDEK